MKKREIYTMAWYEAYRTTCYWQERRRKSVDKSFKALCGKYVKEYRAKQDELMKLIKEAED